VKIYVARQPIFDRHRAVYAYELLFRKGLNEVLRDLDGDQATSAVLTNAFSLIGMDVLTSGKRAFINFTRNLLVREIATTFPKEKVVVEILEDVEPDAHVIHACQHLKEQGYTLVLDDFIYQTRMRPLIKLADIIKVDFLNTSYQERRQAIQNLEQFQVAVLAEKVETTEDFQMALELGYAYVQGFFFSRPETLSAQDIPGYKLNYLQILYEINQPEIVLESLEQLILREVSISYKLLRFINSAYFGLRHRIKTVRHALTMLGVQEIRKWASLVALSGMGEDKPHELAVHCALRGKFCELLGQKAGLADFRTDLYLMGLFSLVDAFVDQPLTEILAHLPVIPEVHDALLRGKGPLSPIYQLVLAYEAADWEDVSRLVQTLKMDEQSIPTLYQQALSWTNLIFYQER
jgi:EAL and modified HD-GYP domain-containing signal transduction protein